jgi:hypothetical protein
LKRNLKFLFAISLIILLLYVLFTCAPNTRWKDIDLSIERNLVFGTSLYSENDLASNDVDDIKNNPEALDLISIMMKEKKPYPLKVIKSQWKMISTAPIWKKFFETTDQVEWGYQIVLENISKHTLNIVFHSIHFELQDKDGFVLKEIDRTFTELPYTIYWSDQDWVHQFDTLKTWNSESIDNYFFYNPYPGIYPFDLDQEEFVFKETSVEKGKIAGRLAKIKAKIKYSFYIN